MHQGSCLCGSVRYTIEGEPGPLTFCHCNACRKANGSAFLAAIEVEAAGFEVSDPDGRLAAFESSPGVFRHFCGHCGSPLFSRRPGPPERIRVRPGTLDTPFSAPLHRHIFHAYRAAWYRPDQLAPSHPGGIDSAPAQGAGPPGC